MSPRSDVAKRMVEAAAAFLYSLDPEQRQLAASPFPSDEERRRWFYTPTDHGGLPLLAMRPAQQQLAFRLVATGLSRPAYVTVSTIIGLENVLDELEGWSSQFERERGRDPGLYYLRVFGEPGETRSWSWRFGGHHVSINHLIVDGDVKSSTPMFLGANPASAPLLGPHLLRPMAGAEDLARELVHGLGSAQRSVAVVSPDAPRDLLDANSPRVGEAAPAGLPAAELTDAQRELLRTVLDVYVRRVPDALADAEAAKYAGQRIDALHFAWAGGIESGEPHYYRVQGPRLLLEYDNTQNDANHVHSVWRDPEGDFGDDVLARHYREASSDHGHS